MSTLPPPGKQNKAVRGYSHSLSLSATAEAVRKGKGQLSISPCPQSTRLTMHTDNLFQSLRGPPRAPEKAPPTPRPARRGQQESMLMVAGQLPRGLAQLSRAAAEIQQSTECPSEQLPRSPEHEAAPGTTPAAAALPWKSKKGTDPLLDAAVPLLFHSPAFVEPPSAQGGDSFPL